MLMFRELVVPRFCRAIGVAAPAAAILPVTLRLLSRQGFHGGQAVRPNGLRGERRKEIALEGARLGFFGAYPQFCVVHRGPRGESLILKNGHQRRTANNSAFETCHAVGIIAGLSLWSSTYILPFRRARGRLSGRVLQGASRRSNRTPCSGSARHEGCCGSSSRVLQRPRGEEHRLPRWWPRQR